jgi:hypothetical protein
MALISFATANQIGDRFLDLLSRLGIDPPAGSGIESELLSITELFEVANNPELVQDEARRAWILRTAVGIQDLAAKVLAVESLHEFPNFLDHLKLISDTKYPVASLAQNAASRYDDDTARKIAEFYLGCLAASVGTNVRLDHPSNAVGDNPDVIVDVEEAGPPVRKRAWALAIKTISSTKGQTIYERIKDGAEQIDREACKADVGIVIINTKSAIDHEAMWSPATSFTNEVEAIDALGNQVRALVEAADKERPTAEWDRLFTGRTVRPVLFMAHSIARVPTLLSSETAMPIKLFMPFDASGSADQVAHNLADVLNDYMQKIRLGIPGKEGQEPT